MPRIRLQPLTRARGDALGAAGRAWGGRCSALLAATATCSCTITVGLRFRTSAERLPD